MLSQAESWDGGNSLILQGYSGVYVTSQSLSHLAAKELSFPYSLSTQPLGNKNNKNSLV